MYDWNDLRCFLAVARGGTTLAAAKSLRINSTTVGRRIAALEDALDVRLFDRLQAGYRLTEAGEEILADAERVEREAAALEAKLEAKRRRLSGVVRATTTEIMANTFLTPCLVDFADAYPDIRVELLIADHKVDLLRGEADVAIRGGERPTEGGLVARKISDVAWSVFCSRSYVRRRGCPRSLDELNGHFVIRGDGPSAFLPGVRWLERNAPHASVVTRSNSLSNVVVAVKAGLGIAVLPCFVGDAEPDLVRCLPPIPDVQSAVWQVTPEALRDVPRIRAFNDFIATRTAAVRLQMMGLKPLTVVAA